MTYNANFPVSADVLANPTNLTNRDDPGFELHGVISRIQDILEALEAKVGIGSSTPGATAAVLRRTGSGASAWGAIQNADISPNNVTSDKIYPGGAGSANTVLRTTDGTTSLFGKVTTGDLAASSFASGQTTGQITQIATITVPTQSANNVGAGGANNMTGGLLVITTQGGPVLLLLTLKGDFVASGAADSIVQFWEGGGAVQTMLVSGLNSTASQVRSAQFLFTPAAGTHNYQLVWYNSVSVMVTTGGGWFSAVEFKR